MTRRLNPCFVLLFVSLFALARPALAHQSSDAFLNFKVHGQDVEQRLDIALSDLDRDLALDANADGVLSWGEVRARWSEIEHLSDASVRWRADGSPCQPVDRAPPSLENHSDGAHAVLIRTWRCPTAVQEIEVDYRLFQHTDAGHRGIARIVGAAGEPTVLVPGAGPSQLAVGAGYSLFGFVRQGMQHIASGLDHVLFLATLLLVAVWRRDGSTWQPRESARAAWGETFKLVTAFTVAHSITLGLAASGIIDPPSRWVESLIALTVLIAALDNLRPFVPGPRWGMVGVFGLVHGVGFAGPLQDLGLRGSELVLPLLGFNLGVELGQLAVVMLLLPLAVALRSKLVYRRWVVPAGSGLVAALATVWLAERALAIQILS
jgi:hypothetical protein